MDTAYRCTAQNSAQPLRTWAPSPARRRWPTGAAAREGRRPGCGPAPGRPLGAAAWPCRVRALGRLSRTALFLLPLLISAARVGLAAAGAAPPVPGITAAASGPSRPALPSVRHFPGQGQGQDGEPDPLARLSKVFGIKRVPMRIMNGVPPQYMTELYDVVADHNGLTRAAGPYNANTVRSFPDRDSVHQEHYFYNVSYYLSEEDEDPERLLEAEFHVFKMKPRPARSAEPLPPHHLQLKLYQVLDPQNVNSSEGVRLLDARRISTHAHGWYTFKVTKAVENWRLHQAENYGLLLTAETNKGERLISDSSYIRFAQRHQHHDSKQPILVVFAEDSNMKKHPNFVSPDDEDYQEIREDSEKAREKEEAKERPHQQEQGAGHSADPDGLPGHAGFSRSPNFRQGVMMLNERARSRQRAAGGPSAPPSPSPLPPAPTRTRSRRRKRRDTLPVNGTIGGGGGGGGRGGGAGKAKKRLGGGRRKRMYDVQGVQGFRYRRSCAKHKMYVDFDEIGWSGWIISPKGYDAYHCHGECPFPLGQSQKPTNHATVQSIVHALGVGTKHVGTPCCVPNKLFSISLLYFDDDENVILKQYDDMVAASCGCH